VTFRVPGWLLWTVAVLAGVGAIVGAFLVGRASDSGSSPESASQRSATCSESAAKRAALESQFAEKIREAGDAAVEVDGAASSFPAGPFFHDKRGFRVGILKCVDLNGDGQREMVAGLGAGAGGRIFHWAVFASSETGDWRLAFSRHGVPVDILVIRDGALVELTPTYEEYDPLCCPSGHRVATFDFVGDRFRMTAPRSSGAERLIVVGQAGVSRLGPLDVQSASPVDARLAFGGPSSPSVDSGEACPLAWSNIGLEIVFANLGGRDPCGPEGRVGSFEVSGAAAEQAGWRTNKGARIGIGTRQLLQRYPTASFENGQLVLVSIPTPFGDSGVTPALSATMFRGKALRFDGYVGAAGE